METYQLISEFIFYIVAAIVVIFSIINIVINKSIIYIILIFTNLPLTLLFFLNHYSNVKISAGFIFIIIECIILPLLVLIYYYSKWSFPKHMIKQSMLINEIGKTMQIILIPYIVIFYLISLFNFILSTYLEK